MKYLFWNAFLMFFLLLIFSNDYNLIALVLCTCMYACMYVVMPYNAIYCPFIILLPSLAFNKQNNYYIGWNAADCNFKLMSLRIISAISFLFSGIVSRSSTLTGKGFFFLWVRGEMASGVDSLDVFNLFKLLRFWRGLLNKEKV